MSRRLWLVRHGETDWSASGRFNGWTDIPLNTRGRRQARAVAGQLRGRRFLTVWSSDLCRAAETARLAETEPALDPRLRELDFGTLEGRTWAELSRRTREALIDFDAFTAPDGESVATMRDRVLEFVHALPAGDHLVFTHGGVIRLISREGIERVAEPGEVVVLDVGARAARGTPAADQRPLEIAACPSPRSSDSSPSTPPSYLTESSR